MATVEDLKAQRAAAGARYAAAVAELHDAFVDLAALDRALSNARALGEEQRTFFGGLGADFQSVLRHPVYAPVIGLGRNWNDAIREQTETYLASLG